ncbi:MAG: membrane protein, partial [bacterium]
MPIWPVNIVKTPKARMAWLLLLLSFLAVYNFFSTELVIRFVFIISFTLGLEYLLWKIRGTTPFVPLAGVITALIIFLLFDNISPFYYAIIPVTLAVVQKQFLRLGKQHIFNPAVFGLYAASLVGYPTFWWGVSWGWLPLVLIIIGGVWITLFTLKQHYIVVTYLFSSLVIYAYLLGEVPTLSSLAGAFLAGSFWFFTFVMLPEPITSPHKNKNRLTYALFVALLPLVLLNRIPGDTM